MSNSNESSVFDRNAAVWDEKPGRLKLVETIAEAICRTARPTPEMDLFDYGCGTGLLSLLLVPQVRSVVGADTSSGMLEQFQKKIDRHRLENVRLLQLDLGKEPPPEERFDLITTSMTLHHVEDLDAVLRAFAAMLRPGGTMCLVDLDTEPGNFHRNAEEACVFHYGFDREELQNKLVSLGLTEVDADTAMVMPRELEDGSSADFPIFIITARRSRTDASPRE